MRNRAFMSGIYILVLGSCSTSPSQVFAKAIKTEKEKPPRYKEKPQKPLYPGHHNLNEAYENKKLRQRNLRYT
tara:strand:- start:1949 stop:2167 length:219 start_codon:yes stop_codon:yes gene_type:complete